MGSSVSNPASHNRQNDKSAGSAEHVLSALWRHACGFKTLPDFHASISRFYVGKWETDKLERQIGNSPRRYGYTREEIAS